MVWKLRVKRGRLRNEPTEKVMNQIVGNLLCRRRELGPPSECYSYQSRISDSDVIR